MGRRPRKTMGPVIILLSILALFMGLTGCGGSGGGGDDDTQEVQPETLTGRFIDASVEGMLYMSGETSAFTNGNGLFSYEKGVQVSFYISDIQLGKATDGDSIVSPLDLVLNGSIDTPEVINIARLLQTLDVDPEEARIQIPLSVHTRALGESLSFSDPAFEADAERIIRLLTESNSDYSSVPSLVSAEIARTHLAKSLGIDTGDEAGPEPDDGDGNTDDGDGDTGDDTDEGGDESETLLPFTAEEIAGTWSATVDNGTGLRYVFYYHFSADGTGTIVYTPPYPITDPQSIDWTIAADGSLSYNEYSSGGKESTIIKRYANGDVVWSTVEGVVAFKAAFEKQTDTPDDGEGDEDDEGDDADEIEAFIGSWSVIDTQVEAGQTSQGQWEISESYGALAASGKWRAFMPGTTDYGDVTIEFPFTGASVTLTSGKLGFTATGTATATASKYPLFQLKSGFTLVILNATTDACEYKLSVTEELWNQILPPDSDGYNYSGRASVVIE